ncbi:MAG TPA: hypothetical protein VMX97_04145 [Hyphomicrobiaceae bacterium]|nr:hypothetical protein [Hyphomicrobiaceae bacterium]
MARWLGLITAVLGLISIVIALHYRPEGSTQPGEIVWYGIGAVALGALHYFEQWPFRRR